MAPGLALRVSWICLLLSCAAAFPATKGDYKYPYTATWSNSGSSGSSNAPSGGARPPMMPLSQPQAPAQQPSSTSSFSAPSAPALKAPAGGTSYVSPPTSPEKKAPSFPVPYRGGSSAGYPALHMGDGPMPYRGGSSAGYPTLHMGGGSSAGYPALHMGGGSSAGYPALHMGGGSSAGYPAPRNDDGPMPYGGPTPDASLRPAQPAGEAYVSAPAFLPLPPHPFPEFRWEAVPETLSETPSETSPLPPSTYIIQTRNGFQRARDFHSHMQYSPEYLPPPINPPTENNAPSNTPSKAPRNLPPSGPKGGMLYRG